MAELARYVQEAARNGLAAHQVEEGLFRRLLSLGHALFSQFLALQGSGDIGPELALPGEQVLQREPERVDREYATIFGDYVISRTVYSTGPQQKREAPLDARLQLPDSKFSYLVQSWTQLLAAEQPYQQVSRIFDTIFQRGSNAKRTTYIPIATP